MENFTFEEKNLVCIYNSAGTREGVIAALTEMRGYLQPDEDELRSLTDSALGKLRVMPDEDFNAMDLTPDFEMEDIVHAG